MNTSGNSFLITGGASGIGMALAAELVRHGNDVLICGRRADRLAEAKQQIPELETVAADVSSPAARRELLELVRRRSPRVNVLVNNAGIQQLVDFTAGERDLMKADEEMAINLVAPIHLSALFIPYLAELPQAAIVNISSGLGFAPLAHMPVYCATKAALHSLTLSMRHQLRNTSIRVFEVIPPIVASELGASHRPAGVNAAAMPAETAATLIADALSRDDYEFALGEAANLVARREAMFPFMNRR
jgi:uncharacterized oxidoreductase